MFRRVLYLFHIFVLSLLQDLCEGQNSVPRNAVSEVRGGVAWWRWRKLLPVGRSTWQLFLRVAEISSSSFTMSVYFSVVSLSKKLKVFGELVFFSWLSRSIRVRTSVRATKWRINQKFLAGGEADWAKFGFVRNVLAQRSGND